MLGVAWVVLSICVGILAVNWKGRNPIGWSILALAVTPLLAGIALMVVANISGEKAKAEAEGVFNLEKFDADLRGLKNLLDKNIYTQQEFDNRRREIIENLHDVSLDESVEIILLKLSKLSEDGVLSTAELMEIKVILQDSSARPITGFAI
jgi:hypothetical protein